MQEALLPSRILVAKGWSAIHQAAGKPVTLAGPYKYVRHPQRKNSCLKNIRTNTTNT